MIIILGQAFNPNAVVFSLLQLQAPEGIHISFSTGRVCSFSPQLKW